MSAKGNKSSKEALKVLYGCRCLLTGIKTKKLQYHHIQKREWGGPATVENGANLIDGIHQWLHEVETKDIEMFMLVNECLLLYKKCLDGHFEELTQDWEEEIMPKFDKVYNEYMGKKKKKGRR